MTTTLIIARHGNTFEPDETPTRVGGRTDLKLAKKGYIQGEALGKALLDKCLLPDSVYASTLIRTQETARMACEIMNINPDIACLDMFDEIDYGVDENQTEDVVIARIGAQAIKDWNDHAIVPDGWHVDPTKIITAWKNFAAQLAQNANGQDKTVLVVTSNGVARFAPHITGDFKGFCARYPLKLRTGAYGILTYDSDEQWRVRAWDERP